MNIRHQTPIYVSHRHKFLLVTIRKCATESIKAWKKLWREDPVAHVKMNDCSYVDFLKYNRSYKSFALVRNPFNRAVSSWQRAKEKYTPKGRDGTIEADIWGDTPAHFERFLGELGRVPDPHWFPQAFWISDKARSRLIVNHLIHLELLDLEWKSITWLTGLPHKMPPWKNRATLPPEVSAYYSERAEQLVLEFYEDDFKLLDYSRARNGIDWTEED